MKALVLGCFLFLLSGMMAAEDAGAMNSMTGNLFEERGRLYFATEPGFMTTPYRVSWRKGLAPKKICRWTRNHRCPKLTIHFHRIEHSPGDEPVLVQAFVKAPPGDFALLLKPARKAPSKNRLPSSQRQPAGKSKGKPKTRLSR